MTMVKVHNLNVHPYKEFFVDRMIEIPANDFVEMDEDEAERFVAKFTFPKKDGQGRPDPLYFKKLKIVRDKPKEAAVDPLVVHATGQKAANEAELKSILSGLSHLLVKDEEAEESIKKQNKELKKENKELKTRLEIIEEKLGLKGEKHDESV